MDATKALMQTIRPEINAALEAIAKRHNIAALKLTSGTYNPDGKSFSFKLEGMAQGGKDPDALRYEQNASLLMLPPLGTTFKINSFHFTIVGLKKGGANVLCTRSDNGDNRYKVHVDTVRRRCAEAAHA